MNIQTLSRLLIVLGGAMGSLGLTGCAGVARPPAIRPQATAEGLPGITEYYEKATQHHRRAVRKAIRDERSWALRRLAQNSGELRKETQSWDSEARLVALAEPERPAARDAVRAFRVALTDLQTAAAGGQLADVRSQYERTLAAYRHVREAVPTPD